MDPRVVDRKGKTVRVKHPKQLSDAHFLVLRYQDNDHHKKHPLHRRLTVGGVRYRLVGLYMGQQKCGHQIGIACPTGRWRDWSISDADLHKDGIGPIHIHFDGPQWRTKWWDAWEELVHVTKYGMNRSEFCNLSPHNPPNHSLDRYRGTNAGTLSIDAVFFAA